MEKKLALLLPGFLDSPDYLHMNIFSDELKLLNYDVIKIDPCNLWRGNGNINNYSITNYVEQIRDTINNNHNNYSEILLMGHSMGGFVGIISAASIDYITRVIAICPPARLDLIIQHKWNDEGFRISERDLPEDNTRFTKFTVPISFADDATKYSAIDSAKKIIIPLLVVICDEDEVVSPLETEQICIPGKENIKLIRIEGLGHDFRKSRDETMKVWKEIVLSGGIFGQQI